MNQNCHLKNRLSLLLCAGLLTLCVFPAQAQWKSESFRLKNGWNAIYLHVDAGYAELSNLLATTAISEVWFWAPTLTTREFITSYESPTTAGSEWLSFQTSDPGAATLHRLRGNAAYLIKSDAPDDTIWSVRGIPVPPYYEWSSNGENFVGLSTPAGAEVSFMTYLAEEPALSSLEIFGYVGGDLVDNPQQVLALSQTPVTRGQAFWMNASNFNSYFHPFDLSLQRRSGVDFVGNSGQSTVRVRNRTDREITVSLELLPSESEPAPELFDLGDPNAPDVSPSSLPGIEFNTPIQVDLPPVIVRGAINPADLTFPFTALSAGNHSVTLSPKGEIGSEADIVLGIDLASLGGNQGDLFAGIIRFTDSLGHASIDIPTRVIKQSRDGLWVGEARVDQVMNSTTVSTTQTLGATSSSAPLRLILHHGPEGAGKVTRLLQRVYFGFSNEFEPLLATQEGSLADEFLSLSRRVSSVHLPWTEDNATWAFDNNLDGANPLTTVVTTGFNDHQSNPFLHSYHPDHDNKSAFFESGQPQGEESYGISRSIILSLDSVASSDFESVTRAGNQTLSGDYQETISINGKGATAKSYTVQGRFSVGRLSSDLPLTQGNL